MLPAEYNKLYAENPNKWSSEDHNKMIFRYMSKYGEPKNLLEIGCGIGHTLKFFCNKWPDVPCTGLDFSCIAIDICRKNIPQAEFTCIDVMEYKPSSKFEMILLVGVVEHFDNPAEKLEYIYEKLLKSKGTMYMEVPNCLSYTHAPKEEGLFRILHGTRQLEWHYKRETWEQIIKDSGFEILEKITGPQKHNEFIWILTK